MKSIILPLVLTLLIEVPLGAIILRGKEAHLPLILINTLTNPALNATLIILFSLTQSYTLYWISVFFGELAVFIGEGALIRRLCDVSPGRALVSSTILNTCSLTIGLAITALIR